MSKWLVWQGQKGSIAKKISQLQIQKCFGFKPYSRRDYIVCQSFRSFLPIEVRTLWQALFFRYFHEVVVDVVVVVVVVLFFALLWRLSGHVRRPFHLGKNILAFLEVLCNGFYPPFCSYWIFSHNWFIFDYFGAN